MDILGKVLYFVIMMLAIKYFNIAMNKAEDKNTNPKIKIILRAVVIIVFLISIVSLFFYSIFIVEVGIVRRIIAGIVALMFLIFMVHTIKKYIKDDNKNS